MTLNAFNTLDSSLDHHHTSTFDSLNMGMNLGGGMDMNMEYVPNSHGAHGQCVFEDGQFGFADVGVGGGVAEY